MMRTDEKGRTFIGKLRSYAEGTCLEEKYWKTLSKIGKALNVEKDKIKAKNEMLSYCNSLTDNGFEYLVFDYLAETVLIMVTDG